eukprot:2549781-Amphidinium_carterae.1
MLGHRVRGLAHKRAHGINCASNVSQDELVFHHLPSLAKYCRLPLCNNDVSAEERRCLGLRQAELTAAPLYQVPCRFPAVLHYDARAP